jgi:hypothetical protein
MLSTLTNEPVSSDPEMCAADANDKAHSSACLFRQDCTVFAFSEPVAGGSLNLKPVGVCVLPACASPGVGSVKARLLRSGIADGGFEEGREGGWEVVCKGSWGGCCILKFASIEYPSFIMAANGEIHYGDPDLLAQGTEKLICYD